MVFPTFFNLSLNLSIRSSWSEPQSAPSLFFYWLYRASPSLDAKNIINPVLTIWRCPCVSLLLCCWKRCLLWPLCSLGKTLLAFALLHPVLQICRPNLPVSPGISWLPTFAFQSPIMKRTSVLDVSSRRPYRTLSFFGISGWGLDLDYCGIEWFASETDRDPSVVFEIAPKYCISDSFVDYDGYSISSKGFLPTVVDIMVFWINFTHFSPF